MTNRPFLMTAVASLVFALSAPAEPTGEERLAELEAQARGQSERAEERIHHLEEAARHLEEAGFGHEAARAREHAVLLQNDLRHRLEAFEELRQRHAEEGRRQELEDLVRQAMGELTEELRRELGADLDANPEPPQAPTPADEHARAEEHRLMTLRNWERIKEVARGERPLAAPPAGRLEPVPDAHPVPPWQNAPAPPAEADPEGGGAADHEAVLQQILRTLQRIEAKLAE